GSAA
ncbi:hypothetical protein A2U01_0106222, partial [Trifolium medium]